MGKKYLTALVVFLAFALVFALFRGVIGEAVNAALVAAGEGSNIKIDLADSQKKKKATAKVVGLRSIPRAAQLKISKDAPVSPPLSALTPDASKQKIRRKLFVSEWAALGPVKIPQTKDAALDQAKSLDVPFIENEPAAAPGAQTPPNAAWKKITVLSNDGRIAANEAFRRDKPPFAIYYAADVQFPENLEKAILLPGASGYIKVWFNGRQVFATGAKTPRRADAARIPVEIRKGKNRIVVKSIYTSVSSYIYLRFATVNNTPLIPK